MQRSLLLRGNRGQLHRFGERMRDYGPEINGAGPAERLPVLGHGSTIYAVNLPAKEIRDGCNEARLVYRWHRLPKHNCVHRLTQWANFEGGRMPEQFRPEAQLKIDARRCQPAWLAAARDELAPNPLSKNRGPKTRTMRGSAY